MLSQVKNKRVRARLIKREQANLQSQAHQVLREHFSVFEPATCKGVLLFGQDCKQYRIRQQLADQLIKTSSTWSVACYILTREKNGKCKIEEEVIDVLTPCKHNEIKDQIADAHLDWFANYEWPDNVITLAWIAGSYGNVPTLDQAFKIFESMGVWRDLLAQWQSKELVDYG